MTARDKRPLPIAATFARNLAGTLNKTVCDGAFVGMTLRPKDEMVVFGTGMRRDQRATPIRMRSRGSVPVYLTVSGKLYLDQAGYLTVRDSRYAVSAGDPETLLYHYDYERFKQDYPPAHVQVCEAGPAWDALLAASDGLKHEVAKLHLPVGGIRYRPSVEDIVEALIMEKILVGKPGWEDAIADGRKRYHQQQLRAAVRSDPSTAIIELQDAGYTVVPPDRSADVIEFKQRSRRGWRSGRR